MRAGAFDSVEANRARLLASAGRALEAAEQAEAQASQDSLFGEAEAPRGGAHAYIDAPPWDARQKLLEEKAALGFYLSGHLFSIYERELAKFPRTPLAKLSPNDKVWMAGVVVSARTQMTRRGRMMVVMLDDATRAGRDLGVQRAVRAPPRQAEGGRAAHRLGQGAGRPVLRRPARAGGGSARPRSAARALRRAPQDLDERRRRRQAPAAGARALPRHRQRRLPGGRVLRQRQGRVRGGARRELARAARQQADLRPRRLAHAGERRASSSAPSSPSAPRQGFSFSKFR